MYFEHAVNLRDVIRFLRWNPRLGMVDVAAEEGGAAAERGLGLDLLRCESISALGAATCRRVLQRSYAALISLAPLSRDTRTVISCAPPHLGPAVPEMGGEWHLLWLYSRLRSGPVTLYLPAGTVLRRIPAALAGFDEVLVHAASAEPYTLAVRTMLPSLNDALRHAVVMVQGHGATVHVPFPMPAPPGPDGHYASLAWPPPGPGRPEPPTTVDPKWHAERAALYDSEAVRAAREVCGLDLACGFITLVRAASNPWCVSAVSFGVPISAAQTSYTVCAGLVEKKVLGVDSTTAHTRFQRRAALELLSFITQWQCRDLALEPDLPGKGQLTPPPSEPLLFDGTTLGPFLG